MLHLEGWGESRVALPATDQPAVTEASAVVGEAVAIMAAVVAASSRPGVGAAVDRPGPNAAP